MNNLVLLAGLIGGFSGVLGLPTLYFLARNAKRESEALRDKPLRDALAAMTEERNEMRDDRNYWREKADNLESRMQGRTGQ